MAVNDVSRQWREKIREDIRKGAELNTPFLFMNVLAAIIASYGLLANSPAVIIGAMIVAMLLGPIAGIALAVVDSNMKLLLQGFGTVLAGTVAVVATAFIIGSFHKDIPITNEILARTAPNLIDLMVALAGGAAGAYASSSPRLSVAFVGVAIATALVPPLCSGSILFAHGQFSLGLGACLLTFTNMVAIQFASSLVFWFTGFHKVDRVSGQSIGIFLQRNMVSILILLVLGIFLAINLNKSVSQQLFETRTRYVLGQIVDASKGSHLVEIRFQKVHADSSAGKTIVRAVVRGMTPPSAEQVAEMEAKIPSPPDGTAKELRVRFVETLIITRDGQIGKDIHFGTGE